MTKNTDEYCSSSTCWHDTGPTDWRLRLRTTDLQGSKYF